MPQQILPQFNMPNIVGAFQQGQDRGRMLQANQLAGQAYGAQGADRQQALSQLAGLDPGLAVDLGNSLQTQQHQQMADQQTQQVYHAKKINGAANFMLQAVQSGDPARIQGAYQSVRPYLAELGAADGKVPPEQFDPAMLPHLYQIVGQTGGIPEQKLTVVGQGSTALGPDGKVAYQSQPQATGELATLKAAAADPALLHTYQQMHPRPVAASGGGMSRAPMGYRWNADGSGLEPIPGGPADSLGSGQGLSSGAIENNAWTFLGTGKLPAVGRGKEGIAQRTAVQNKAAEIAKQAGISPAELQTVPGRNRALQSSLTSIQKRSDAMTAAEEGFINNTQTALTVSSGLDRFKSPVINKWYLGGKSAMGDPQVAALDASIRAMATDYARIMSGATGSGGTPISTTEDAIKLIRRDLSDQSLRAVVDVLNKDIEGQKHAVHDTRGNILGAMQQLHDSALPSASQSGGAPQPGTVDGGYVFHGGDPADPNNWEKL